MNAHELRQKYLDFFKAHGHVIVPSASLVPENDPSTLFTGSGMQPMVPYLLGEPHPMGTRLADSQKCFRSQDIDEVGDNRHTTFFEMLGNWSLGDYFKQEQLTWMFEFLTHELSLDPSRLFFSIFVGNETIGIPRDSEAEEILKTCFTSANANINPDGHIFAYPEKKNWWSRSGVPDNMPVGEPGGPDCEMFWDFGVQHNLHENSAWKNEACHINCDCGRYMEIGNNVFMAYRKTEQGFEPLPKKNVDFGGGLERMVAAVLDNPDMFRIGLFDSARSVIEQLSGKSYGAIADETFAFRVILDHVRAATFLIGDGILPSNKDQGYFVRRLLRRAVRFGRRLNVHEALVRSVSDAFITTYAQAYPKLAEKHDVILKEVETEELKFGKTIEQGLRELKKIVSSTGTFTGTDTFNLYQSYGFPLELTTEELTRSHNMTVDEAQFRADFKKHQELSRAGSEKKFAGGLADHSEQSTKYHTATHLLHQALRQVLGPHVEQRGSNITQERLRFDFSHAEKVTADELKQVEAIVNEQIEKALPIHFEMLTVAEAKARGAIGLFGDKYAQIGDKIKVYFVGEGDHSFSKEICGGPHVENSKELGHFSITKEEAVSAGVRRIKAVLG